MKRLERYVEKINSGVLKDAKTKLVIVNECQKYQVRMQLKDKYKECCYKPYTSLNMRLMSRFEILEYLKLMVEYGAVERLAKNYK